MIELREAPGARARGVFTVLNETAAPVSIAVETDTMGPQGYTGGDPSAWLAVTPNHLELAPGATGEVAYVATVPAGLAGEMAAEVVFIQNVGSGGGLQVRFGMAVYVSIRGTEHLEAAIEDLSVQRDHDGMASTWVRVANHGNIHCRPEGTVRLFSAEGTMLGEQPLIRGMPVHPGAVSSFPVNFPSLRVEPGTYAVEAQLGCVSASGLPVALQLRRTTTIPATDDQPSPDVAVP